MGLTANPSETNATLLHFQCLKSIGRSKRITDLAFVIYDVFQTNVKSLEGVCLKSATPGYELCYCPSLPPPPHSEVSC